MLGDFLYGTDGRQTFQIAWLLVSNLKKKKKKVFLEMLDLRTLIRKLLNSFQGDLYTCISSFSLLFFLSLPRTDEPGGLWGCKELNTTEPLSTQTHAMSC